MLPKKNKEELTTEAINTQLKNKTMQSILQKHLTPEDMERLEKFKTLLVLGKEEEAIKFQHDLENIFWKGNTEKQRNALSVLQAGRPAIKPMGMFEKLNSGMALAFCMRAETLNLEEIHKKNAQNLKKIMDSQLKSVQEFENLLTETASFVQGISPDLAQSMRKTAEQIAKDKETLKDFSVPSNFRQTSRR